MITIEQLLESVDLDFIPRFVTKDEEGEITIFSHRPTPEGWCAEWREYEGDYKAFGELKLSEFADKPWQECIYEVPRKTTGKIEKLTGVLNRKRKIVFPSDVSQEDIISKLHEVIDAVNELKGEQRIKNDETRI